MKKVKRAELHLGTTVTKKAVSTIFIRNFRA